MEELYIRNPVVINQLQYPRKVYFVDSGFMTALSTKFSKNSGRLFENMIFNKFSGENETMHYYKDSNDNEVDFVVSEGNRAKALYQVCFELTDEETRQREVKSLVKTGEVLNCKNINLLTIEKPENLVLPDNIKIIQVTEML